MLEGLDIQVLVKARWVLRTPGGENSPQLARSDIQFGLQTRVEMLEGLDIQVLVKARWVLRTPGGKVSLHDRMRRGVNKKHVIRLNILSGMAPPCEARRLRG